VTQLTDGQTRAIETLRMRAGRRLRRSGNNRRRRMIEMVVLAVTGLTLCLLAYGVGSLAVTLVEMWSNRYEP
jgi:hypothetical protein